ncbi:MAG: hypothetical protein HQL95_13455 [Magnetococcales bacterium]|nr:hypothetical protein [Magnetococcales bacterium]
MSSPLSDLQSILSGRTSVAGRIVSMANGMARVATAQGMVEVMLDEGGNVGDRVSVREGKAVRVQDGVEVPVFHV